MKFNRIIVIVTDSVAPAMHRMPKNLVTKGPIHTAISTPMYL